MLKVILLTDAANPHSQKWANELVKKGVDVIIVSLNDAEIENVPVYVVKSASYQKRKSNIEYNRIAVLFEALPEIKKIVKSIKPDIIHSHYASSYGLFGAMCGYNPLVVSVWGSDITDFPLQGYLKKNIIKSVLNKADRITVSSRYLLNETKKYTTKKPSLIYFGTDFDEFKPQEASSKLKNRHSFVFGTVKSLYAHYGINYLIEAASIIKDELDEWELWIAGDGVMKQELHDMVRKMNLEQNVKFLGRIKSNEVSRVLNGMDVFVAPSLRESFGVSAVEASACGLPVIASDIGGLGEIVADGKSGFLVPPANPHIIAGKLLQLYKDKKLRDEMGSFGRDFVKNKFALKDNVEKMLGLYNEIIDRRS